jgi:hypothetical protein
MSSEIRELRVGMNRHDANLIVSNNQVMMLQLTTATALAPTTPFSVDKEEPAYHQEEEDIRKNPCFPHSSCSSVDNATAPAANTAADLKNLTNNVIASKENALKTAIIVEDNDDDNESEQVISMLLFKKRVMEEIELAERDKLRAEFTAIHEQLARDEDDDDEDELKKKRRVGGRYVDADQEVIVNSGDDFGDKLYEPSSIVNEINKEEDSERGGEGEVDAGLIGEFTKQQQEKAAHVKRAQDNCYRLLVFDQ